MSAERYRILAIDDDPAITLLLQLNLEQTDKYDVATLNTTTGAVHTALQFHPDLILLDFDMPGVSGDQLASVFQEHPLLKSVPIVGLTGLTTWEELGARHGVIGGMRMLAKPVDITKVLACLAEELQAPEQRPRAHTL